MLARRDFAVQRVRREIGRMNCKQLLRVFRDPGPLDPRLLGID